MVKVGDKVDVSMKIAEIFQDEKGIRYTVELLSGKGYQSMKVSKDDIKSIVE